MLRFVVFLLALLAGSRAYSQVKQVRIGHNIVSDLNDLSDGFLDFVANSGYTHVLAHADMVGSSGSGDWTNGNYNWSGTRRLDSRLRSVFQRANARGLKVIPCFNLGSSHSGHWSVTNSAIAFNQGTDVNQRATMFAPEINGIDKTFASYLQVINSAYQASGIGGSLEYIHIGHDEVSVGDKLLIANSSGIDREYIRNNGNNQAAYQKLMATEMARRVNQVRTIFPNTRVMFSADMWDTEFYGNWTFQAWTANGTIRISVKETVQRSELANVKAHLVPILWRNRRDHGIGNSYNADNAIRHFTDAGFPSVIVSPAYEAWAPPLQAGRDMVRDWVQSAQAGPYRGKVLGYAAHTWWDGGATWATRPFDPVFRVIPELAKRANFHRERTDILQLWNNGGSLSVETYASDGSRFNYLSGGAKLGGASAMQYLQGDVNWDDRADLFQCWNNNGQLAVESYLSNGTRLDYVSGTQGLGGAGNLAFLPGDINGDFSTDILHLFNNNGSLSVNAYTFNGTQWAYYSGNYVLGGTTAIKFLTGDVNGDGRTDLLQLWNNGGSLSVETYVSDGTRLRYQSGGYKLGGATGEFHAADMNGDGRTDIVQLWNNGGRLGIETYSSDGSRFNYLSGGYTVGGFTSLRYMIGDVNADGRADVLQLWDNGGKLSVETYASNGTRFNYLSGSYVLGGATALDYLLGDLNRDGRSDIFKLWNNNGQLMVESYTSDGTRFSLASGGYPLGGATALKFLAGDLTGNR